MNKNFLLLILLTLALSVQAQRRHRQRPVPMQSYTINVQSPRQTVEHFGASDAWSMFRLGLWPEEQQRQVADWLFSTDNDAQGRPKGIGLSIWRFNLGAGSAEQGDSAQISPGTRTECFLRLDGTWDWTRQQGQRRFLQLAKERGVPYLLAFCNSAPVQFTKNGLATNTGRGGTINLREDSYDDFASFMAKAMKGLKEHDGIDINYISPVNEPDGHWNWLGPKQEGSPATNREIARLTKKLSQALRKEGVPTQILVDESSDLRCVLGVYQTTWERGNTLETFFNRDSTRTYLGRTPQVLPLIGAHSYWTNTPLKFMRDIRKQLRHKVDSLGVRYWQTELCIMGNDEEIGGGTPYDFSMRTALYVARVIHHDLVFGDACSWSWWRAVGGDYRDNLIRVYSQDGMVTGTAVDSKLLWALGNYSRFVRPGAVRYDITARNSQDEIVPEGDSDNFGVLCSAYRNADGSWVVVAINYAERAMPFDLLFSDGSQHQWQQYRTSDASAESLAPVGVASGRVSLAPRSITTFVAK